MNFEEYNILGNIVDDTFKARDVAGSFKIIAKIVSENKRIAKFIKQLQYFYSNPSKKN